MIKRLLCFCLLLVWVFPAHAEDYAKPDWTNLLRTLVRFNALNINDDTTLDEYAAVSECDLYKVLYKDDFKWNKVRAAIRESIGQNLSTFPTSYAYQTELQLDRYDFQDKLFRLTAKTTLHNVNTFRIYKVEGESCDNVKTKLIPTAFRAVLDTPVFFDGLPLSQPDAEALLQQMKLDKNSDRVVNAVFKMRVIYIAPTHLSHVPGDSRGYTQNGNDEERTIRLDVRLDSIEFYEDKALTRLIYKLQP